MIYKKNKRHSKLQSTEDVLQEFLLQGKSPLSHGFKRWKLWRNWEEVVGKTIAKNTTPVDYNKGTLFVWVKHPAIMQNLIFLREEVMEKINAHIGQKWVLRISFTLDRKSVPDISEATEGFKQFVSKSKF
ncbi:MAG: DUF721 domain-containing protein [Bdellovibrionaceae bacterium]|nr:DUF721 domain-containing protein [Pseudobdellovibrionaceae bacterium]